MKKASLFLIGIFICLQASGFPERPDPQMTPGTLCTNDDDDFED